MALILHISGATATLIEPILIRHLTHFQCVAGIESEECLLFTIANATGTQVHVLKVQYSAMNRSNLLEWFVCCWHT